MKKAAAYLRISKDMAGEGLGIERQRESCQSLADAKGWKLDTAWILDENDTSATSRRRRPKFERLLKAMETGEVEAVVAYAMDRLVRRLDDLVRLIDVAERYGVPVATVAGDIDLSTGQGRGLAKLLGVVASIEADNLRGRLLDKAEQNAKAGKVTNGGRRPYGYDLTRTKVVPGEADVIRAVASSLVGGESTSSLVRGLNGRGVKTAHGARWTVKKLRATMSRPALAGRVVHRGSLVRDGDGNAIRGQWPAILDGETFDQVQVALAAARKVQPNWTTDRKHLLSGLARCGLCDAKMVAFLQSNGRWSYLCTASRHLSRDEGNVNAFVVGEVKARAAATSFDVAGWSSEEQDQVRRDIAELERRKYAAAVQFADGSLDADMLKVIAARFDEQIQELQSRQVEGFSSEIDAARFLLDDFDEMSIDDQRGAIDMWVTRVEILPGAKRGRGFDPSLVKIEWRDLSTYRWFLVAEA